MLVLTRKANEEIVIGDNIRVVVLEVRKDGRVRLGIEAPDWIQVDRKEVREAKEQNPLGEGSDS